VNDFERRQLLMLLGKAFEEAAHEGARRAIEHNERARQAVQGQPDEQAVAAMPGKLLLSAKDVQRLLGLGHSKVEALVHSGRIPSFKVDGKRFVRAEDLQTFIAGEFYRQNPDLQAEAQQPARRQAS
jgi:excisionase family DNA binding protein